MGADQAQFPEDHLVLLLAHMWSCTATAVKHAFAASTPSSLHYSGARECEPLCLKQRVVRSGRCHLADLQWRSASLLQCLGTQFYETDMGAPSAQLLKTYQQMLLQVVDALYDASHDLLFHQVMYAERP